MKPDKPLRHILLIVSYDGLLFGGWQIQEGRRVRTVQGEIEKAIRKVFHKSIRVSASGRTDRGVHARAQGVSFSFKGAIPVQAVPRALNAALPEDIRIQRAYEVKDSFNARFSCIRKQYRYRILNSVCGDVFFRNYAWWVSDVLDIVSMRKAAAVLVGRKDFSSFANEKGSYEHCVRHILSCTVTARRPYITIDIVSTGFLRKMVRNIVGFLVDVGKGTRSYADAKRVLQSRDRAAIGMPAPACGLYLWEVFYDKKFFLKQQRELKITNNNKQITGKLQ